MTPDYTAKVQLKQSRISVPDVVAELTVASIKRFWRISTTVTRIFPRITRHRSLLNAKAIRPIRRLRKLPPPRLKLIGSLIKNGAKAYLIQKKETTETIRNDGYLHNIGPRSLRT